MKSEAHYYYYYYYYCYLYYYYLHIVFSLPPIFCSYVAVVVLVDVVVRASGKFFSLLKSLSWLNM